MRYRLAMRCADETLYLEGMTGERTIMMVDDPVEAIMLDWDAAVALAWLAGFGDELKLEEVRDA